MGKGLGRPSVAVLGGGVGGMSAAHELAERGFRVRVFEQRDVPGGKARSMRAPGTGTGGRPDLPGEHGFRFFPSFYKHLPDTMARIPYGDHNVADNLVATTRAQMSRRGKPSIVFPDRFPMSLDDVAQFGRSFWDARDIGVSPVDIAFFLERLLVLMASCDARRFDDYEFRSWWEFSGAEHRSKAYQDFFADGMTRTLIASQAREMNARTGGYILLQLLYGFATPGARVDRVLNGPTSDVWLTPWHHWLHELGVEYHTNAAVRALHFAGNRITGVTVEEGGVERIETADYYVSSLPVEILHHLMTPDIAEAEPLLGSLDKILTRWMTGIQYWLADDVPLTNGHVIYLNTPWSLTSISQQQFWSGFDLDSMGDGRASGILSIDVSDWETPGVLYGKTAMECTAAEISAEVFAQLKADLNVNGQDVLRDENQLGWFLDTDIVWPNPHKIVNLEPHVINTAGSWPNRPEPVTAIPNFFVASDFARTFTDLATMEAANEAARRAVNGILDASGSDARRCGVWPLREPAAFAGLRILDALRYRSNREVALA